MSDAAILALMEELLRAVQERSISRATAAATPATIPKPSSVPAVPTHAAATPTVPAIPAVPTHAAATPTVPAIPAVPAATPAAPAIPARPGGYPKKTFRGRPLPEGGGGPNT